jgi:hypothetical protein
MFQNSPWTRRKSRNAARAVSHPQQQVPDFQLGRDLLRFGDGEIGLDLARTAQDDVPDHGSDQTGATR